MLEFLLFVLSRYHQNNRCCRRYCAVCHALFSSLGGFAFLVNRDWLRSRGNSRGRVLWWETEALPGTQSVPLSRDAVVALRPTWAFRCGYDLTGKEKKTSIGTTATTWEEEKTAFGLLERDHFLIFPFRHKVLLLVNALKSMRCSSNGGLGGGVESSRE